MPRHDNRHAGPEGDSAVIIVFVIIMVALLLYLAGSTRPYTVKQDTMHAQVSVPSLPPM